MADTAQIPPDYTPDTPPKGGGKTRLLTISDLDGRTVAAQHAIGLRDRLINERGGPERLSAMEQAMIESVACLTAMVTDQLARWLKGDPVDVAELSTMLNVRRREAEKIGIQIKPIDVTPDLRTYVERGGK